MRSICNDIDNDNGVILNIEKLIASNGARFNGFSIVFETKTCRVTYLASMLLFCCFPRKANQN